MTYRIENNTIQKKKILLDSKSLNLSERSVLQSSDSGFFQLTYLDMGFQPSYHLTEDPTPRISISPGQIYFMLFMYIVLNLCLPIDTSFSLSNFY